MPTAQTSKMLAFGPGPQTVAAQEDILDSHSTRVLAAVDFC